MFNRRQFLTRMSVVVVLPGAFRWVGIQRATSKLGANLSPDQLQVLAVAAYEFIPRGDGMPSATDAGGVEYLQYLCWQYPSIQQEITEFLNTMRQAAKAHFGTEFLSLRHKQRVQLLEDIENGRAPGFRNFLSYVYEAYYTGPQVQATISCSRPPVLVDDLEMLLAPVRNMKQLYREAP